jgi:membrane protein DedA with SNARE-associated domain
MRVVDFVQSHLDVLVRHLLPVVFFVFLIEAAGVPFPSRLVLLVAATLADGPRQLVGLVAVSTAGALIGDHVPYLAGALTGPRILAFYCRITLGSARCVEKTVGYFKRFGAAAILMARFSASVRLFASALSGCGHITYGKFVAFDMAGTLAYTALCVTLGHLVGAQVAEILSRHGAARLLVLIGPVALAGLIAYRLWRRSRYGPAMAEVLVAESTCVEGPRVTP